LKAKLALMHNVRKKAINQKVEEDSNITLGGINKSPLRVTFLIIYKKTKNIELHM
jgi:hypothetical protein